MNYYPEKQILKYQKTSVEMGLIISYLKSLQIDKEIKKTTYIIFRNESSNGMSGINNNYAGFQADSGRWSAKYDSDIAGVVMMPENGTNKQRLFLAFNDFKGCINMLAERVESRGLFVGGITHKVLTMHIMTSDDLSIAYKREWVSGNPLAVPTKQESDNFLSMYRQADKIF